MLWTDFLGNPGVPSYVFYLFDPDTMKFVENRALANAAKGFRVTRIDLNEIKLEYTIGACRYGSRIIAVHGKNPVEVSQRESNTCG